jgi:hypothetical protein
MPEQRHPLLPALLHWLRLLKRYADSLVIERIDYKVVLSRFFSRYLLI